MIRYDKLFDLLRHKGMQKSDLRNIVSSRTVAKLSKGENINIEVIDKICAYLNCQPGDIMEFISIEETKEKALEIDGNLQTILSTLKSQGYTNEQIEDMVNQFSKAFISSLLAGNNAMHDAIDNIFKDTPEE